MTYIFYSPSVWHGDVASGVVAHASFQYRAVGSMHVNQHAVRLTPITTGMLHERSVTEQLVSYTLVLVNGRTYGKAGSLRVLPILGTTD
jgi:hypothetical protein